MDIYGLFGEKLGHSFSPKIFQKLFELYNIDGAYNLFEIKRENFKNAVSSAKTLNVKGVTVTIPYKEEVMKQIDVLDEKVTEIGACNCVHFKDDKTYGYNTDYFGYKDGLIRNGIDVSNKEVVVLGDGGASKSVVRVLLDENAKKVTIVSRKNIALNDERVEVISYDDLENYGNGYMIVNTTPVGMYPNINDKIVDESILKKFEVCSDVVYNPIDTAFLKDAKENGLITVDGLYMLVSQAMCAFKIFTGIEVSDENYEIIYKEVKSLLGKKI